MSGEDFAAPRNDGADTTADIAIIGAGLAGTTIAALAARAGHSTVLIDTHASMPPEFRAEKLGKPHMDLFDEFGLGEVVRGIATPSEEALVYRFGRLVSQERRTEYGVPYSTLINGLRAALPASVGFKVGRVDAIVSGPDRQRIALTDGSRIEARLLVVATGLGDTIRRSIGIRRVETGKSHSLALGFSLAGAAADYPFDNLTYYARHRPSPFAYTTLFRMGDEIRAHLFTYRTAGDAWTRQFVARPQAVLCDLMPEIADLCGGFALAGGVKVRPIDLIATEDYRRPGVVLVGDAFCTTCPIPGVGIRRVLTDAGRLATHFLPQWLATPGMGVDKINAYYDDETKQLMDAQGLRSSHYARRIAIEPGAIWTMRRLRNDAARRVISRVTGFRTHLALLGRAGEGHAEA